MQLLFLNISPLILLILSKSLGIFWGSSYATNQFIDIRCSGQCIWSTPLRKIEHLRKRIKDFNYSNQPPLNFQDWIKVDNSIRKNKRSILFFYILFISFFWLFFEVLDNLLYLSSEFARIFTPFDIFIDFSITSFISYLILSCDATDPEARGGIIIDLIKFIQNILSYFTLKPKMRIDHCLSRYEDLEVKRFCDQFTRSEEELIESVNTLINKISDTSIRKQYWQKFTDLRLAISNGQYEHESRSRFLLTAYIDMTLDLAPILY